jgi:hypothetical protein
MLITQLTSHPMNITKEYFDKALKNLASKSDLKALLLKPI